MRWIGLLEGLKLFADTWVIWLRRHYPLDVSAGISANSLGEIQVLDPSIVLVQNNGAKSLESDEDKLKRIQKEIRQNFRRKTHVVVIEKSFHSRGIVILKASQCWEIYVGGLIYDSGERRSRSDAVRYVRAMGTGDEVHLSAVLRKFDCERENLAMECLKKEFDASKYEVVPFDKRTQGLSCLSFRLLSATGCRLRGIMNENQAYPTKAFDGTRALSSPCLFTCYQTECY